MNDAVKTHSTIHRPGGRACGFLLAAVIAAASARAFGQSLLDQTLGPVAPAPVATDAKPEPAKDPVKPAVDPTGAQGTSVGGTDIISPDAVRRVDDADLINRLIQPEDAAAKGSAAKQQMTDMLERMGQSQKLLTDKDPGPVTQETQRRIVANLDTLIEYARQQQQSGPSEGKPGEQQPGQDRQYSEGKQGPHNEGGTTAAQESTLPRGNAATPRPNEDIRSKGPEEWGSLPSRARDLISHGANEEYLSSYRDMIDRYYQALAQLGKSRKR